MRKNIQYLDPITTLEFSIAPNYQSGVISGSMFDKELRFRSSGRLPMDLFLFLQVLTWRTLHSGQGFSHLEAYAVLREAQQLLISRDSGIGYIQLPDDPREKVIYGGELKANYNVHITSKFLGKWKRLENGNTGLEKLIGTYKCGQQTGFCISAAVSLKPNSVTFVEEVFPEFHIYRSEHPNRDSNNNTYDIPHSIFKELELHVPNSILRQLQYASTSESIEVLLTCTRFLREAGHDEEALGLLKIVVNHAPHCNNWRVRLSSTISLALIHLNAGEYNASSELLQGLLATDLPNPEESLVILLTLAFTYKRQHRLQKQRQCLREAVAIVTSSESSYLKDRATVELYFANESFAIAKEEIENKLSDLKGSELYGYKSLLAKCMDLLGDSQSARKLSSELATHYQAEDNDLCELNERLQIVSISVRLSEFGRASAEFERILYLTKQTGHPHSSSVFLYYNALLHHTNGDYKKELLSLENALSIGLKTEDTYLQGFILWRMAQTLLVCVENRDSSLSDHMTDLSWLPGLISVGQQIRISHLTLTVDETTQTRYLNSLGESSLEIQNSALRVRTYLSSLVGQVALTSQITVECAVTLAYARYMYLFDNNQYSEALNVIQELRTIRPTEFVNSLTDLTTWLQHEYEFADITGRQSLTRFLRESPYRLLRSDPTYRQQFILQLEGHEENEEYDTLYLGIAFYYEGQYEKAYTLTRESVDMDSERLLANRYHAKCALRLELFEEVLSSLPVDSNIPQQISMRAICLSTSGDLVAADAEYEKLVHTWDHPLSRMLRSANNIKRFEISSEPEVLQQCIDDLEVAIQAPGTSSSVFNFLLHCRMLQYDSTAARMVCLAAIDAELNQREAFFTLALLFALEGNIVEAIDNCLRSIQLMATGDSLMLLAILHLIQGEEASAEIWFQRFVSLGNIPESLGGIIRSQLRRNPDALRHHVEAFYGVNFIDYASETEQLGRYVVESGFDTDFLHDFISQHILPTVAVDPSCKDILCNCSYRTLERQLSSFLTDRGSILETVGHPDLALEFYRKAIEYERFLENGLQIYARWRCSELAL